MIIYVALFIFFASIMLIFFQRSHFLSVLLIMEVITLRLFFIALLLFGIGGSLRGSRFGLVFLVFGVYEAANGLGLLVSRTRSSGIDQLRGLFALGF